jgi:hypothetical protein
MAIKTISLELDAYEKLRRMKRGRESFSDVVRRARFDAGDSTGARILQELQRLHQAPGAVPRQTFAYWQAAVAEDAASARITPSPWE